MEKVEAILGHFRKCVYIVLHPDWSELDIKLLNQGRFQFHLLISVRCDYMALAIKVLKQRCTDMHIRD